MSRNASRRPWTLALPLAVALLPGCQTLYATGQAWQRQECVKIADAPERQRCLASHSTSYEDYKRQADAAKGGAQP